MIASASLQIVKSKRLNFQSSLRWRGVCALNFRIRTSNTTICWTDYMTLWDKMPQVYRKFKTPEFVFVNLGVCSHCQMHLKKQMQFLQNRLRKSDYLLIENLSRLRSRERSASFKTFEPLNGVEQFCSTECSKCSLDHPSGYQSHIVRQKSFWTKKFWMNAKLKSIKFKDKQI